MAILKVAHMGHPLLRAKALPVSPAEIASPGFQRLIDDMFETMAEYSGIGLAGPQVHTSLRVFVAGVRETDDVETMDDDEMPLVALINPTIVATTNARVHGWEGCLSIPDVRGRVPRAESIRVSAYDRSGRQLEINASGFPARVIQHETDHLDGVLFFDRMTSLESLTYMEEYRRYWMKDEDDEDGDGDGA